MRQTASKTKENLWGKWHTNWVGNLWGSGIKASNLVKIDAMIPESVAYASWPTNGGVMFVLARPWEKAKL